MLFRSDARFDPVPLVEGASTPEAVADRLLSAALAAPPRPERRQAIVEFLHSQSAASEHARLVAALALVTALPEYQLA